MFKGHTKINISVVKLAAFVGLLFSSLLAFSTPTYAIAKASTLSLGIQSNKIEVLITPLRDGTFGETNKDIITIGTDNFTGYSLSVSTLGGTDLVSANGDKIESLPSSISEYAFVTNSDYNNKWGFRPSQYIDNGSAVSNNYFLPIPSGEGLLIAKSSSANSMSGNQITTDSFSISSGARVDNTMLAGSYTNTYVVSAVANTIVYNITYDSNTSGTVMHMPSPNPKPISVSGDAPVEESFVTLSTAIPTHDTKLFMGWCDEATMTDPNTGNDVCTGNAYAAGESMPVDMTDEPNITLYAIWSGTKFPIVWSHEGACEFHGATNSNITGEECSEYHDTRFIDTGIALYNNENYEKDYEMHFKLVSYNPSQQVNYFGSEDNNQQTFVNDKPEATAGDKLAPGAVIRRDGSSIEFSSKNKSIRVTQRTQYENVQEASLFRINGVIYYRVNDGPLVFLQDITDFNQQFGLTAWFGAYPKDDCDGNNGPCTVPKRIPEATMSDMYIRLGDYPDEDLNTINFVSNNNTTEIKSTYLMKNGEALTTLPSAPVFSKHAFLGWFTELDGGTKISESIIPIASTDYYAHWTGSVELAVFERDTIQMSTDKTQTIRLTNSDEIEPRTFKSNNTNIVTVDANTGVITPVAAGSTTITMKGSISGKSRTINVVVADAAYTVTFDPMGGSSISDIVVFDGSAIDPLPVSYLDGFQFEGWYTEPDGAGIELTTSTIFTSETPTTYYANWDEAIAVCRAATELHTETCNRGSNGCRNAGFAKGATITYGSLITTPGTTPVAGNAFTCDIDGDRDFDEDNERFYFVGIQSGKATLIYHKNIENINESYSVALNRLPTSSTPGWTNTSLTPYTSGEFIGKVARYLSRDEALTLCNNQTSGLGRNGNCLFLFEKSNFSDTKLVDGWWLGSTNNSRVHTGTTSITMNSGVNAVRPVIEIPMSLISY